MINREKVIRALECCTGYCCEEIGCPYFDIEDDCEEKWRDDAIALLKAQESGRVYITNCTSDGGWSEGDCPFCGMRLDSFYNRSFCGSCGRAVKWE